MPTCGAWCTIDDLPERDPLRGDNEQVDTAVLDVCFQIATDVLYEFSRRKYPGVCTRTDRPSAQYRAADRWNYWPADAIGPWLRSGSYWGWCSCNRSPDYGCGTVSEVKLRGYPVRDITGVKIDGQAFTSFAVVGGRYLQRTDGQAFPCCQDFAKADTEPGTWSVTYTFGRTPPQGGVTAAAFLGSQLYLALDPDAVNDGRCKLPKRITSITRQGVTAVVLDPLNLFADGKTGLALCDMWVASDRYGDEHRPGRVLIPGRSRR